MKTRIVRIGNSRGIRLPKTVLEQCGLQDEVELSVEEDRLVIRALEKQRASWEAASRGMAERGDDCLLDEEYLRSTEWDETEWEW